MGLTHDLLTVLSSYSGGYRLLRARMGSGLAISDRYDHSSISKDSNASLRVTLSRLETKGFVERKRGIWHITKEGVAYLARKKTLLLPSHTPHGAVTDKKKPKRLIVMFDVPETQRHKRDWLRFELLGLGFVMLQKSAWLGPAPLPREFVKSVNELKLLPYLKFFEAKEADIV